MPSGDFPIGLCFSFLQYSSQVTSPTGTCKYHNGTPCEAPMLRCNTQDLRVSICMDNHQPRKYFYSSARTSRGSTCTQACRAQQPAPHCSQSSMHDFYQATQAKRYLLSYLPTAPACHSEVCMDLSMDKLSPHWSDSVVYCLVFLPTLSELD